MEPVAGQSHVLRPLGSVQAVKHPFQPGRELRRDTSRVVAGEKQLQPAVAK